MWHVSAYTVGSSCSRRRDGVPFVYRLVGQEREEIAQFDLETVRYYEYFIEE